MKYSFIQKIFLVIIILFSSEVSAQVVPVQIARNAAYNFIRQLNSNLKSSDEMVLSHAFQTNEGEPALYVFSTGNEGFIILSAEESAYPVIAYSLTEPFDGNSTSFPPSFKFWMEQRTAEIEEIRNAQYPVDIKSSELWNQMNSGTVNAAELKSKSVTPLLKSVWNQDCYYNELCPVDLTGPCDRVYAGCVATAMGQIMYYWRFPMTGNGTTSYSAPPYGTQYVNFGSSTYNWDQMKGTIYSSHPELAKMLYHAGVSVKMDYSPSGSGASSSDVPSAMKNKFRYASATYRSKSNYTTTNWNNLLIGNLDNKYPIYYSGSGNSGGHAWNCDGYQGTDYFHFDWGWSGAYNGYYYLDNLNPGSNTFNSWQAAVVDIYPPAASYPYNCSGQKQLSAISGSFDDGSGPKALYQSNANCSWLIKPTLPVDWIRLNFVYFDTESSNDVVTIYDGETTSSPVLGTYSGSNLPSMIQCNGQSMLVTFSSNGNIQSNGFLAEYSANPSKFCSGTTNITELSGTIEDGSGPDFQYSNSSNCRWLFDFPESQKILINFLEFDTEPGMDKLRFLDVNNNSLIAEYSGSNLPSPLEINVPKLQIHFISSASVQMDGWKLNYSVITGFENIVDDEIRVFPNPASQVVTFEPVPQGQYTEICLYDLSGRLYLQKVADSPEKNFSVDISSLPRGLFLVQIKFTDKIFRTKLCIQ